MDRKAVIAFIALILLNITLAFYEPLSMMVFTDEGQYLLIAKKMLDGWVPYRDIIENKPPGMYIALMPAVLLGGTDIVKLRIYAALIAGLTAFFVYLIGRKLKDERLGLLAAFIFTAFNAFTGFCGYALMTDTICNLLLSALFYILICLDVDYVKIFITGLLFAAACSVRQTSVFMVIPIAFVLYNLPKRIERYRAAAAFILGGAVLAIPAFLYLFFNSALYDAYYWMFLHFIEGDAPGVGHRFWDMSLLAVLFSAFIIPTVIGILKFGKKRDAILIWLLGGFIVSQVGYSYWHNYLFIAPPISIFIGRGMEALIEMWNKRKKDSRGIPVMFFVMFAFGVMLLFLAFELKVTGESTINISWKDQKGISDFISSRTSRQDRIFVFGVNSEVYYLSGREPATSMTFFGGYTCKMSEEENDRYIFQPIENPRTRYFVTNHLNIVDMCGNNSRIELAVMKYVNESYAYAGTWGPLDLYERKEQ